MYLRELTISGVKCFGNAGEQFKVDLTRPDQSLAGFTVVAGRNGSGKTTFLRCAAIAVSAQETANLLQPSFEGWRNVKIPENEGAWIIGRVVVTPRDAPGATPGVRLPEDIRQIMVDDARESVTPSATYRLQVGDPPITEEAHPLLAEETKEEREERIARTYYPHRIRHSGRGPFVAGYGPLRRLTGHASDAQSLMVSRGPEARLISLFREDASLIESVTWLKEIYLRRLEQKVGAAELETSVLRILQDGLLPEGMQIERIDSDGLWVGRRGLSVRLRDVSDGYKTMAALVLDLLRQMHMTFGELGVEQRDGHWIVPVEGIVLIDEIDAHLHVSWQQRVGFWLKEHFPNIQFVVTTHSPFVCQAADHRGIIRLPGPGDERPGGHVSEEEFRTIVNGDVDEAVLTSLFGLEHGHSLKSEHLRDRIALLESRLIQGKANEEEKAELKRSTAELPPTNATRADTVLRKLGETK